MAHGRRKMTLRCLIFAMLAMLWAVPALSGEATPAGTGLQQDEILGARSASRSVFAAQAAERREAKQAGLTALGQELTNLQSSLRTVRALDVVGSGGTVAGSKTSGGAAASPQAAPKSAPNARALSFQRAYDGVVTKKEALRAKISTLHSPRQRAMAAALLNDLDRLDPALKRAAADAGTPGAPSLDAAAQDIGSAEPALVGGSGKPPAPTFTTRIHHRRPVPRVP